MLTLCCGAATDAGRLRELNEDSLCNGTTLFAVADGMGGHAAGEVASGIVVDYLSRIQNRTDLKPDDIRAELARANQEILAEISRNPLCAGMGTTVAGIGVVYVAGSEHWVVFNIGDSRVYRFIDDALIQMTVDHSEVEELIAVGRLSPQDARLHPRRNVVTRALGSDPAPEADVWVLPPAAGERYLLCSDGLTTEIVDAQIADVLRREPRAHQAAEALVTAAVAAGGRDNVTVIIVDHAAERVDAITAAGDDAARDDTVPRPRGVPEVAV
jgi:PPM family protein phosphatase